MVGSALVRRLSGEECEIVGLGRDTGDLRRQDVVEGWFSAAQPDLVFVAAAKVGGIGANSAAPADFIYDNLMIAANIINAAKTIGVEKLVFLGSSCIYPRAAHQPIPEDALLSGSLEATNEWYAIAKIAGIKLCQAYRRQFGCDFISAQPTNLYGPGDNFDLETSHVVPALMRKAHAAKAAGSATLTVWGSGSPLREFLHVDDLADALVFISKWYSEEPPINVGTGEELSIRDLAREIARVVGFEGTISFDSSRPDGTPRKLVDSTRLRKLGWEPGISLRAGLQSTYDWYKPTFAVADNQAHVA
ncbi:MAG: GDP-L-fucose synthase [Verrucomicrobiota bacterium]|nr:GDP-L-fucose synthase [Verrucomicrobiota bacterium]